MSEIDELQRRITAAMDRVASGVEALSGGNAGDTEALKQALDEEKTVNAQLTERVRVLGERQAKALEAMETRATASEARMTQLDTDLQRLRRANAQLSEACAALRDANAEGVGDAHLINKAMMAELEALRAARTAEVAQADTLLAALTPLLETAQTEETA